MAKKNTTKKAKPKKAKGVSVEKFAEFMETSERTVRRWRKDEILILDEDGNILPEESKRNVEARIDFTKRPGPGKKKRGEEPSDESASRLLEARADKEEALADLRRLEADEASGELMLKSDCGKHGRAVAEVILSWLSRFATVGTPKILPYIDPDKADQFLIRTILQELADDLQRGIYEEVKKLPGSADGE